MREEAIPLLDCPHIWKKKKKEAFGITSLCHILSCISIRPSVSELYTFKVVNKELSAITLQMDSNEAVCKGKLCFQQEIKT